MNKIRQQLMRSGNVKAELHNVDPVTGRQKIKAVRGNDVTEAKRRKALAFLMRHAVEA